MYIDIRKTLCNRWLVSQGERCCRGKKTENVAIWFWLCYRNNCVLWQFLCNFYMKSDIFLLFFLTIIYICKKSSFLTSFSRCYMFLHFSKYPASIAYPCITPILFIKILTHFPTYCCRFIHVSPTANKMVFNVVERFILFISTAKCTGTLHTDYKLLPSLGHKTV